MKIAFDLRSLSTGTVSGVENYTANLLHNLLSVDKQNEYLLFYNAFKKASAPQSVDLTSNFAHNDFNYINSQQKISKIPSKILNLAFKLNLKKVEDFTGPVDWFYMPNLNQFSIAPQTKLAITVHDLSPVITPEFYNLKRRIWHKFLNYKKSFERANVLFAVSEHTKNDLINIFNIKPEKIVVAYPAVSSSASFQTPTEFEMREVRNKYNLPGEYILFLNTIEPRKNLSGLIKAFENLNSNSSLVIAGRLGWKYRADFEQIKKSKKSDKIKYIGYVSEKHKLGLIKLAKALVYPSFYEGFGFQALEAMLVGTPVIASNLTSLPEVVGNAGMLVNPYSTESITLGIEKVLTDTELRNVLIKNANDQVLKFNWQITANKILENLK